MANFGLGLAQGFQQGLNMSEALRQRQMRDALAEASGLTPTEIPGQNISAPEVASRNLQADIAAGLTPEDVQGLQRAAPQAETTPTRYTMGGVTYDRPLTQDQIDAARTRAKAAAYGRFGESAQEELLLRGLRQEEFARAEEDRKKAEAQRAAELHPLKVETERLGLRTATDQAALASANRNALANMAQMRADNTPITAQSLAALAAKTGADYTTLVSAQTAHLGFTEKEAADKMFAALIRQSN
mgnify:CR=1 FL=1